MTLNSTLDKFHYNGNVKLTTPLKSGEKNPLLNIHVLDMTLQLHIFLRRFTQ